MNEFLCFINLIGEENNGIYRYEFIFTNDIDNFEVIEDNEPCCLSETIEPSTYEIIHIVKMKIKLDLIQDNCCFSFKHAKLGIVSIAWEDISAYEEYPEDGRIFFRFGETYEEVEEKLAMKNILMM
jgi:hypothetical protein